MTDHREFKVNAVLAGGGIGPDNAKIFEDIVRKAGGSEGNIGIVVVNSYPWSWDLDVCLADGLEDEEAMACADNYGWRFGNSKINIEYYGRILKDLGIGQYTGIYLDPTIREENSNPLLIDAVNSCTGFFFTGGDQSRGIFALRDDKGKASPVLQAIQKKVQRGALMAGTSAGMAIQTKQFVIANGSSLMALTNGARAAAWNISEGELVYEDGVCAGCDQLFYNRFKGVGNFTYGIADTHFSENERTLRLLRLLADSKQRFGFGVDTYTSLNVENGMMTVIGQDGVTILDLHQAKVDQQSEYFGIKNVRISYIRQGDSYNADRDQFRLGGSPIEEIETAELINPDIMDEMEAGGFQMASLLSQLAQSSREIALGYSLSNDPAYRITLTKDDRSRTAILNGKVSVVHIEMKVETIR